MWCPRRNIETLHKVIANIRQQKTNSSSNFFNNIHNKTFKVVFKKSADKLQFNSPTFKLCVVILVSETLKIEQSESLQLLSKSRQTDSNPLVGSTARALVSDCKDSPSRVWSTSELKSYLQEQSNFVFSHRCLIVEPNEEMNPVKKLKIEGRGDALNRILCDANEFANMHKDTEFSRSDLSVINEIRSIFERISNK